MDATEIRCSWARQSSGKATCAQCTGSCRTGNWATRDLFSSPFLSLVSWIRSSWARMQKLNANKFRSGAFLLETYFKQNWMTRYMAPLWRNTKSSKPSRGNGSQTANAASQAWSRACMTSEWMAWHGLETSKSTRLRKREESPRWTRLTQLLNRGIVRVSTRTVRCLFKTRQIR